MWAIRLLFISIFASVGMLNAFSQSNIPDISRAKEDVLQLEPQTNAESFKIPYSKIEIADYRFDTSKLGYTRAYEYVLANVSRPPSTKKIVGSGGIALQLTNTLNSYYRNNLDISSPKSLFIVLKKLWLQSGLTNRMLRLKDTEIGQPYCTICLADLEVFVKEGGTFRALTKVNGSFVIENRKGKDDFPLIVPPFDSLFHKIVLMDKSTILEQKKQFTFDEIDTRYKQRFDIPALTTLALNKGIFLTFDDFRKNRAVYPEFTYTIGKYSIDITIVQDGKSAALYEYWGFFDGKDLYIKPGLIPFKARRAGNTYDFYGNIRYNSRYNDSFSSSDFKINYREVVRQVYPLQLDMETGKVY